ncbi:transcriptional regulator [Paenibacillus dendrobii]|nr:transcriptional regulator [Paenibacillus dendrobii]
MKRYFHTGQLLSSWHNAIVMQRSDEVEQLKEIIDREVLKDLPSYRVSYRLLLVRYYLYNIQLDLANRLITQIRNDNTSATPFEENFFRHSLGIYYFLSGQFRDCIEILTAIDSSHYTEQEYYYHLAIAYHAIHSNTTAYYYGEKALHYFRQTLNMLRIIDTESLMLIQLNMSDASNFPEIVSRYHNLIKTCDLCQAEDRKSKLIHNLAFEHLKRGDYVESCTLFQQVMQLMDKENSVYLSTLDCYITAANRGNILPSSELLQLAKYGHKLAAERKDKRMIDFKLQLYLLQNQMPQYYQCIEEEALPLFRSSGDNYSIERYERKLLDFYLEQNDQARALHYALSLIEAQSQNYKDY